MTTVQLNDQTRLTKEEYLTKLDTAEREIAEGKGVTFTDVEQMNAWLNAL